MLGLCLVGMGEEGILGEGNKGHSGAEPNKTCSGPRMLSGLARALE